MNSREVALWVDERWIIALEKQAGGKSIEEVSQAPSQPSGPMMQM